MSARSDFITRYEGFNASLRSQAIQARGPSENLHNQSAQLFRNGLAVVGFNTLEDFIKKRTSEALTTLSSYNVPFGHLPIKIREACTIGTISSLKFQADLRKCPQKKLEFIHNATSKIASTASTTANYELYDLAFGYDSSNINNNTITKILSAFNVAEPWNNIDFLSSRLGIGGRNLSNEFKNAAIRRHKAAHTANADTPELDLSSYIKDAVTIALSFDALLTMAVDKIRLNGSHTQPFGAEDVNFRFLTQVGNEWKEFSETNRVRAVRNFRDRYDEGLEASRQKVVQRSELLVVIKNDHTIKTWLSHI